MNAFIINITVVIYIIDIWALDSRIGDEKKQKTKKLKFPRTTLLL